MSQSIKNSRRHTPMDADNIVAGREFFFKLGLSPIGYIGFIYALPNLLYPEAITSWNQIRTDEDLQSIRETEEFKQLSRNR